MAQAEFEQKRLCRLHRGATLRCLLPAVLLVGITAAETLVTPARRLDRYPALRFGAVAALLLVQAALALPLWRDMLEGSAKGSFLRLGRTAADRGLPGRLRLVHGQGGEHLPLAGAAALVTLCCEWGVYLRCAARRELPPGGSGGIRPGACRRLRPAPSSARAVWRDSIPMLWSRTCPKNGTMRCCRCCWLLPAC